MCLPKPEYSFTLPSINDDTTLDCRLYHPKQYPESDLLHATKAAIVAHPYAPLGGCYDDPVVASIGKVLLKAGYIVGTFNFRYFSRKQPYRNIKNQCEDCLASDSSLGILFNNTLSFSGFDLSLNVLTIL
jgi:hypothetical protein